MTVTTIQCVDWGLGNDVLQGFFNKPTTLTWGMARIDH